MNKIKNIEKKFCLLVGFVFLFLPICYAFCDTFSFQCGFTSGLGFAGAMLLPNKEK